MDAGKKARLRAFQKLEEIILDVHDSTSQVCEFWHTGVHSFSTGRIKEAVTVLRSVSQTNEVKDTLRTLAVFVAPPTQSSIGNQATRTR